jgi:hypothetical protein
LRRVRNLLLLVVLLVCGASFWMARRSGEPVVAPTVSVVRPQAVDGAAPLETIHIAVLNGTGEPGLARKVSRVLPPLGCVVVMVADAPHDTFARTMLVNRRMTDDQVRWLARQLANPVVVDEWDPRCDEDVVLVLGRDHDRKLKHLAGPR